MAMATTAIATGAAPKLLSYACSKRRRLNPTKQLVGSVKFFIHTTNYASSSTAQPSFPVQASSNSNNSQIDQPDDPSQPQEDLNYLLKLGAGSVAGAAVIKYGSIVFPAITRPNLFQALVMISTPVIVAVLLLVKQSRAEKQR